jgi:hypothetical protein
VRRTLATIAGLALLLPASALAQEAPTPDDPVAYALTAAPPDVAAEATVMDLEGNVLREGTNDFTCIPVPGEPMCLDEPWMEFFDAYVNQKDELEIDRVGIGYMLAGDSGASNIDPYAEGPTPDNEWVRTGPHLMLIVPDPALLEGIPTDPKSGGPYVMWADHHLAHVMIPIDEEGVEMPHR